MKNIEGVFKYSIHLKPSDKKTFFKISKRPMEIWDFESVKTLPKTIKWKDCQMDPIGFCFPESLRGIKHIQDFKKADYRR